ncbi:MAG: pyridoxal 5'-phosphate synthase glutaminase subunit PdxT [Ignavibacteriales bacterium]
MAGKKTVGILALQGAFAEHLDILNKCRVEAKRVRTKEDILSIDGLIIPGGESTTIGKLLVDYDLGQTIVDRAEAGMPIFGTCAGMIVMAKDIVGHEQYSLGLLDISVLRNAYGRQVDSFEADLDIKGIDHPVHGVFIRAPYVDKTWGKTEVLSEFNGNIVMVQDKNLIASSFHPELTRDKTIHNYFIKML